MSLAGEMPADVAARLKDKIRSHGHVKNARRSLRVAMKEFNRRDSINGCHTLVRTIGEILNALECEHQKK